LYFIKIYRINRGFEIFNVGKLLGIFKNLAKDRVEWEIKKSPEIGEDIN